MKILMVSHYFGSHRGGVEIVAERLFRELASRGQEVVWIAGSASPAPVALGASKTVGLPIFNFVEKKVGLPFPIPTIGAFGDIRREISKADVLIIHDCLYLSNIASFALAHRRGIRTLVVQHIAFIPYENRVLRGLMTCANAAITRPMLSRAAQVIFISEKTRNFFGDVTFRRPPEIIFNGVDTEVYRPRSNESKVRLRQKYCLPNERPAVLFVGRFVEKKGMPILRRMAELRPHYTWAFAGWGPLNPCGWNMSNVRVFSGLSGESIAELYQACDLFVLPSTGEGFPLVIQEALASGLPIVSSTDTLSADPKIRELARGVPVYARDAERTATEFVDAIDYELNSAVNTEGIRQRRAFAVSRYSWGFAAERYIQAASRLVSEDPVESIPQCAGDGAKR